LALTWPQCNWSPLRAVEKLKEKLAAMGCTMDDVVVLVFQENHTVEPGTGDVDPMHLATHPGVHLHGYVKLDKKRQFSDASAVFSLDGGEEGDIGGKPNIQAVKSVANWVKYISKEKGPSAFHPTGFDILPLLGPAKRQRQSGKSDEVAKRLKDGQDILSLINDDALAGFAVMNLKKLIEAKHYIDMQKSQIDRSVFQKFLVWEPTVGLLSENGKDRILWNDLKHMFMNQGSSRNHIYLCGETGVGKSYFLQTLRKIANTYEIPRDEEFQDDFLDGTPGKPFFNLMVMDEFVGSRPISWMNQILDPNVMKLKRKGVAPVLKTNPIPCILVSNLPLIRDPVVPYGNESMVYAEVGQKMPQVREAFVARFRYHLFTAGDREAMRRIGDTLVAFLATVTQSAEPENNAFGIEPQVENLSVGAAQYGPDEMQ